MDSGTMTAAYQHSMCEAARQLALGDEVSALLLLRLFTLHGACLFCDAYGDDLPSKRRAAVDRALRCELLRVRRPAVGLIENLVQLWQHEMEP